MATHAHIFSGYTQEHKIKFQIKTLYVQDTLLDVTKYLYTFVCTLGKCGN